MNRPNELHVPTRNAMQKDACRQLNLTQVGNLNPQPRPLLLYSGVKNLKMNWSLVKKKEERKTPGPFPLSKPHLLTTTSSPCPSWVGQLPISCLSSFWGPLAGSRVRLRAQAHQHC